MRCRSSNHLRAFTLIELLVVIGIIAILIGILLPVLASINERGRDVKCQSNLRSIMQAVHGYAAENDGSMPWGFVWDHVRPFDWAPGPLTNDEYYTWASLLAHYMDRRASPAIKNLNFEYADKQHIFAGVMLCPEAAQGNAHLVSYSMNLVVAVWPREEMKVPEAQQGGRALTRPTKQTQLLKDTAVVWDMAVHPGWDRAVWARWSLDIDGQRFFSGAGVPQWRYYQIKDPFAHMPPGTFAQNRPALLDVGPYRYYNRDPGRHDLPPYTYQGNLRFRHRNNTTCNVGFADGSVRQFTGKFKRDKTLQNQNPMNLSHDALRRYFMIKWPTGVQPNRNHPH